MGASPSPACALRDAVALNHGRARAPVAGEKAIVAEVREDRGETLASRRRARVPSERRIARRRGVVAFDRRVALVGRSPCANARRLDSPSL